MQKILLKGPDISMKNENPNVIEIKTLSESALGSGKEYFINAHGSEFFNKPTNLSVWEKLNHILLNLTLLSYQ